MKRNVSIRNAFLMAASVCLMAVFFAGCEKDDPRDVYVGTFNVNEEIRYANGTLEFDNYNIIITKSATNKNDIVINNIVDAGAGISVIASVSGDSFNIPQQSVTIDYVGVGISGSGRREGSTLRFSVFANLTGIGQVNFTCVAVRM